MQPCHNSPIILKMVAGLSSSLLPTGLTGTQARHTTTTIDLPLLHQQAQYYYANSLAINTQSTYGTNHPQLKQATRVTRVSHACCLRVTRVLLSWRRRLFSYTRVWAHACTRTNSFTHTCAYTHTKCLHAGTFASVT